MSVQSSEMQKINAFGRLFAGKSMPQSELCVGFAALVLLLLCAAPLNAQSFHWVETVASTDPSGTEISAIAADDAGNSYATGWYSGATTVGTVALPLPTSGDIFLAKYDSEGNVLWAKSAGGMEWDRASAIAVDHSGNIFVTGHFGYTATFEAITLTGTSLSEFFIAKYDGAGNLLWVRTTSVGGNVSATDLAVDGSGNSYVTGSRSAHNAHTFGNVSLPSRNEGSSFLVKYDSNGNAVWATEGVGCGSLGIDVDATGNVTVTGEFRGTATLGSITLVAQDPFWGDAGFIARYNSAGTVIWAKPITTNLPPAGDLSCQPRKVQVDDLGNSYVVGIFRGTYDFGNTLLTSESIDSFVAKYESNGTLAWVRSIHGSHHQLVRDIATDGSGKILIIGFFHNELRIGTFTYMADNSANQPGSTVDLYFAELDSSGAVLSAETIGGGYTDHGTSVAIDGLGNAFVAGLYSGLVMPVWFGSIPMTSDTGANSFLAKIETPALCPPDTDFDGIQDDVDLQPATASSSFVDASTSPGTRGGVAQRGDQELCISDAPSPDGIRIESIIGGNSPAQVQVLCFGPGVDMNVSNLYAGDCLTVTCLPGPRAVIRHSCSSSKSNDSGKGGLMKRRGTDDLDVELLANGIIVGTLVLPIGNAVTWDPQTLEVVADPTNITSLVVETYEGFETLLPGDSVILSAPGACCFEDLGICDENVLEDDCTADGGRWGGPVSTCTTIDPPCQPRGACCDEYEGSCTDAVQEDDCDGPGQRYGGDGSTCATLSPPCEYNPFRFSVDGISPRYLSITLPAEAGPVGLVATPSCASGTTRYVGMPSGPDNIAVLVDDPSDAAFLTYEEWGRRVHVTGADIVPDTYYEVQFDTGSVDAPELSSIEEGLTTIWGDVSGPFEDGAWTLPDGVVSVLDLLAIQETFSGQSTGLPLYRVDLIGAGADGVDCLPDQSITVLDIVSYLNAFQGLSYEESTPCTEPCQ